ncbi:MAG: hypothetical protein H6732_00010 [Alphaproteobacteria bacterium]|nr:hypothetical protein [Alphaproteobacteria bacterium]
MRSAARGMCLFLVLTGCAGSEGPATDTDDAGADAGRLEEVFPGAHTCVPVSTWFDPDDAPVPGGAVVVHDAEGHALGGLNVRGPAAAAATGDAFALRDRVTAVSACTWEGLTSTCRRRGLVDETAEVPDEEVTDRSTVTTYGADGRRSELIQRVPSQGRVQGSWQRQAWTRDAEGREASGTLEWGPSKAEAEELGAFTADFSRLDDGEIVHVWDGDGDDERYLLDERGRTVSWAIRDSDDADWVETDVVRTWTYTDDGRTVTWESSAFRVTTTYASAEDVVAVSSLVGSRWDVHVKGVEEHVWTKDEEGERRASHVTWGDWTPCGEIDVRVPEFLVPEG